MKVFLILAFLLPTVVFGAPKRHRLEGYFFTKKGRTFFTEHLRTTHPQYQMEWKDRANFKEACVSAKVGECPSTLVSFVRTTRKNKIILTDVQIVSPFNDPLANYEYLAMLKSKSRTKK